MTFTRALPFQSTFPRGERHLCWLVAVKHIHFNPRSLVGNDSQYQPVLRSLQDFNPRSLVGNDGESSLETQIYIISIHVPSWGTTNAGWRAANYSAISIHVPSWGTTAAGWKESGRPGISIHVPSWGTTVNFHKYSLFFYAINIIFLLFIIPSLFSLVLFMLLF